MCHASTFRPSLKIRQTTGIQMLRGRGQLLAVYLLAGTSSAKLVGYAICVWAVARTAEPHGTSTNARATLW